MMERNYQLVAWTENITDEIDFKEIDVKKFGEYLYFIQQINYTKTTIARKIASIRAFYKFLYQYFVY